MEAVFLSDLHLNSIEERNGQTLLRFLISLESRRDPLPQLFLLGDIFDFWLSKHQVFLDRYRPMLDVLERLSKRGMKITYFEGNHDLHVAPYWTRVLGADVRTSAGMFDIGGLRLRCEHGDEMNPDDTAYLKLRAFLRNRFVEAVGHFTSGYFWDAVAKRWSRHSRQKSSAPDPNREDRIRRTIRRHAERVWEQEPYDVIISGHMHVLDDWTFERGGKTIRSINLGSWFDGAKVLVLENGKFEWRHL